MAGSNNEQELLGSDSAGSTLLLSPGSVADEVLNEADSDIFAYLRPMSESARTAFSASVNRALNLDEFVHCRRFLHVTGRYERARSPFTEDEAESEPGPLEWAGAFELSLKALPIQPAEGWSMGTNLGRPTGEIDLLLAPPDKSARHSVSVSKHDPAVLSNSACRVIEDGELIHIGPCAYVFQYTDLHSTPAFEQDLIKLTKEISGPQWTPNQLIMPSSTGAPVPFGKYWCSPSAFAQGSFGKVSAAFTLEGLPVAIKIFKNPNQAVLLNHKALMEYIGHHPNIVQLRESEFHFNIPVPDAFCVYSPLAFASLSHLLGVYEIDLPTKQALMIDYLKGLSFMHQKGVMHRDINPNNLAVTSLDDPDGLIIDLDSATVHDCSTDHEIGTLAYLAPETALLKRNPSGSYDRSIDVWGLGLSMFVVHVGRRMQWTYRDRRGTQLDETVREDSYKVYQQRLNQSEDSENAGFLGLIRRMTSYGVKGRISSASAQSLAEGLSGTRRSKIELKSTRKRRRGE